MNVTLICIAAGTLVGILQLALGIAIGMWIRRASRVSGPAGEDEQRLRDLLAHLGELTSGITQDVQGHQERISHINDRLTESRPAGSTSLTELVVGVVGEVLRANSELQHRLSWAEVQLRQQSEEIADHLSQALTDELTRLPNRRALDEQLRRRLAGYARQGVPFSLMLIDIDYFKKVNDTYGHIAGDRVLCTVADVLRGALRKPDCVARYGGEEFAAILPCTALSEAVIAARHARTAVETATTHFEGHPISVTASVGLTCVQNGDDLLAILRRADDALYASKSGGRNCGHLHDGATCVRIGCGFAGREAEATLADSALHDRKMLRASGSPPALSPELSTACAELRDFAVSHEPAGRQVQGPAVPT